MLRILVQVFNPHPILLRPILAIRYVTYQHSFQIAFQSVSVIERRLLTKLVIRPFNKLREMLLRGFPYKFPLMVLEWH